MKNVSLKKSAIASLALFLLAACGDETTQINQTGLDVVASEDNLPECSAENKGEQFLVMDDATIRVCIEDEWFAIKSGDGTDYSCETEELADKSGLKIICNGDSIGVVLNGARGKAGKDGDKGEDGKDAVLKNDTLENDSEKVATSLDSLAGYTQKGPFLKGSTVYLYELSDGRSLKQTNGNFTTYITQDDGRYKFTARDLISQYAMIIVDGVYRNEVTGAPSNSPIRLRALTDVTMRSSANVNLLTHLEYDRVYSLVIRDKKKVKHAKKQAQAEIFKAFHIDTTGFTGASEDLDVFGATDADAALLAISIMLQGDGNVTDLTVLLTTMANDLEDNGKLDDSLTMASLADWAMYADGVGRLSKFRSNVADWKLSDTVPVFEKFVRGFYGAENNIGKCGGEGIPVGTLMNVKNPRSKYYAATYSDVSKSNVRFICADAGSARWRVATDIEKDTSGFAHKANEGEVKHGAVNRDSMYVYQHGNWRHGTYLDSVMGKGCLPSLNNTVLKASDGEWYTCRGDRTWQYVNDDGVEESSGKGYWDGATDIEKDTNGLSNNFNEGDTALGLITNRVYAFEEGHWIYGSSLDSLIGKGCVKGLKDSIARTSDGGWYRCEVWRVSDVIYNRYWIAVTQIATIDTTGWGSIAPEGGWKDGDVRNGSVTGSTYVYQGGKWRLGTALDSILVGLGGTACLNGGDTSTVKYNDVYYVCTNQAWGDTLRKWTVAPSIYNDTRDLREGCKEDGEYGYGNIVAGLVNTQTNYVCDNGKFRVATPTEENNGRSCLSYIYDHIYKLNGNFEKCTSAGWTPVVDGDTTGIIRDKAHRVYKTVVIGNQLWMKENMNYETDDSRCYDHKAENGSKYGRLYTWEDAMIACPAGSGWHLPSLKDWNELYNVAESGDGNSGYGAYRLMSKTGWGSDGMNGGRDALGFSALPAGDWYYNNGDEGLLFGTAFWSSTEVGDGTMAYATIIEYGHYDMPFIFSGQKNLYLLSVRCILDE